MDRPDGDLEPRKPTPRTVGLIGKRVLDNHEKQWLHYAGRVIARLGHTALYIPTKGFAEAVVGGVEVEGGLTRKLDSNVIETADVTFIYPDTRLLARLLNVYPDLQENARVIVIQNTKELNEVVEALDEILDTRNIARPN